jgi:cephalosporin hydroxylase
MSDLRWLSDIHFLVGDTHFVSYDFFCPPDMTGLASDGHAVYPIAKPRWRIDGYNELLASLKPKNILEVGIWQGGGCVFLDAVCRPDKLAAIEYRKKPVTLLTDYIENRQRSEVISIHYGLDQADVEGVCSLLESEFGGSPLDLVIDDASHMLEETRATFSVVFPHMRPGGMYIIEDWTWAHQSINNAERTEGMFPDKPPLTILAYELLLVLASTEGLIADIRFDRNSIFIQRGDAEWNREVLVLSTLFHARGAALLPDY